MQKYLAIFRYEMKNIFKDRMNVMILVFPIIMLVFSAVIMPLLLKDAGESSAAAMYGSLIMFITFISIGTFLIGALFAFILLDRKDERTLYTIAATPLSVAGYIKFLTVYNLILTIIINIIMLVGTKLLASDAYSYTVGGFTVRLFDDLTYDKIIVFSIVSALYMPALGLFLGGLSTNKIEGFAYMKMSGFLIFIPLLLVLKTFSGGLQYVLGIAPNFWAVKGLMATVTPSNDADINFWLYMLIGAVYSVLLYFPAYKFFIKRSMRV